ncbi:MAG TPA: hypothetical protein VJ827_05195 [Rubrobacter sp.]|nr:hypothetical protein [Rubrobacter sp.]
MGVVSLEILEPQDGQMFFGPAQSTVTLRGNVISTGHGTLFYRWYGGQDGALGAPSVNLSPLTPSLKVGSHVLTLTAKDRAGDSLTDLKEVREAGMAGGRPEPGVAAPCLVHVFIAEMVGVSAGQSLSRANSTLLAVAPKQWWKYIDPDNPALGFELNGDYHKVNKIRYRWRFRPSGPPEGRANGDLVRSRELAFGLHPNNADLFVVRYSGPLPAELGTGNYTLALRVEELVENSNDVTPGHETAPIAVVLT